MYCRPGRAVSASSSRCAGVHSAGRPLRNNAEAAPARSPTAYNSLPVVHSAITCPPHPSKEGGARAMKKIISCLVSVGVLSLALAAPVLADNQHDGRVRGPHAQPTRFQHVRFFRGPSVLTYYYPYP